MKIKHTPVFKFKSKINKKVLKIILTVNTE